MAAKIIIHEGARWAVGNGRSIETWKTRWLPSSESGSVITAKPAEGQSEMVADLINAKKGEWRTLLVKDTFLPHEAKAILSIPLSPLNQADSLVWGKTPNGCFSVKSAYRVAVKCLANLERGEDVAGCSDCSRMSQICKSIWSIKCPSKVKHFLWRACRNILPTKQCLKRRKIITEDGCDFCGESKSSGHILWSCTIAKETWMEVGINCSILTQTPTEFFDVVWFMMNTEGEKDWELFATVAWCLWNNRNKVRHGEAGKNGKSIAVEARNYWAEVRAVKPSFGRPSKPKITHKHWLPPPQGWYKVNVNTAVFKDQG